MTEPKIDRLGSLNLYPLVLMSNIIDTFLDFKLIYENPSHNLKLKDKILFPKIESNSILCELLRIITSALGNSNFKRPYFNYESKVRNEIKEYLSLQYIWNQDTKGLIDILQIKQNQDLSYCRKNSNSKSKILAVLE
ncbi:MAG: hypothetical protein P0116_13435 [Candidatus Nitrosocosmicus sp.]|nr:hypothetical protein [Candidatus Nitrosocosmicus sp.]